MIDQVFESPSLAVPRHGGVSESVAREYRAPHQPAKRRTILVDGFNVLHTVLSKDEREDGWWKRVYRERLLSRIAGWDDAEAPSKNRPTAAHPIDEIWVAFDGDQPAWSVWAEPVATLFAKSPRPSATNSPNDTPAPARRAGLDGGRSQGHHDDHTPCIINSIFVESADDWIVRRARRSTRPTEMIVVTADRQVAGRSRSAGCEVWSPWSFISHCPDEN